RHAADVRGLVAAELAGARVAGAAAHRPAAAVRDGTAVEAARRAGLGLGEGIAGRRAALVEDAAAAAPIAAAAHDSAVLRQAAVVAAAAAVRHEAALTGADLAREQRIAATRAAYAGFTAAAAGRPVGASVALGRAVDEAAAAVAHRSARARARHRRLGGLARRRLAGAGAAVADLAAGAAAHERGAVERPVAAVTPDAAHHGRAAGARARAVLRLAHVPDARTRGADLTQCAARRTRNLTAAAIARRAALDPR